MTSNNDNRVSFRVDDLQLLYEFRSLIAHGQQKMMFNAILKDLVRLLKSEKRHIVIGLLCGGDLHLENYVKPLMERKDELKDG